MGILPEKKDIENIGEACLPLKWPPLHLSKCARASFWSAESINIIFTMSIISWMHCFGMSYLCAENGRVTRVVSTNLFLWTLLYHQHWHLAQLPLSNHLIMSYHCIVTIHLHQGHVDASGIWACLKIGYPKPNGSDPHFPHENGQMVPGKALPTGRSHWMHWSFGQGSITVCHTMSCNKAASKVTELFLGINQMLTKSNWTMSKCGRKPQQKSKKLTESTSLGEASVLLSISHPILSYPLSGHLIWQWKSMQKP